MASETTPRDVAVNSLDGRPRNGEAVLRRGAGLTVAAVGLVAAAGFGAAAGCGSPEYSRRAATGADGASDVGSGGGSGSGGAPQASGGAMGSGGLSASGGAGAAATGGNGSGGAASGGRLGTAGAGTGGAPGTGTGGAGPADAGTGGTGTGGTGTGGVASGGRAATGGAGTGGAGTGGAGTGGAGTGSAGTGGGSDTARYNFESGAQAWSMATGTPMFTSVMRDTSRPFAGAASLAAAITATDAATYQLQVTPNPTMPAGSVVTAHVYVPSGSTVDWLQLYLQEAASPYTWTGTAVAFTAGTWNTLTVTAPTSGGAIGALGVQVHVTGAWTGTVHVDSVNW